MKKTHSAKGDRLRPRAPKRNRHFGPRQHGTGYPGLDISCGLRRIDLARCWMGRVNLNYRLARVSLARRWDGLAGLGHRAAPKLLGPNMDGLDGLGQTLERSSAPWRFHSFMAHSEWAWYLWSNESEAGVRPPRMFR
ncbi:hypothetical protein OIU84_029013 [Salix udensis]|uniref:Uncharacterized protein n=1 Tax=Salix udensis TaxID=889485 RepID=A0AAD6KFE2_9ROSI|nr:hypothetical protein OIU84_029013 [Salix udensis]